MKNLNQYIKESILDNEDDLMGQLDKEVTLYELARWFAECKKKPIQVPTEEFLSKFELLKNQFDNEYKKIDKSKFKNTSMNFPLKEGKYYISLNTNQPDKSQYSSHTIKCIHISKSRPTSTYISNIEGNPYTPKTYRLKYYSPDVIATSGLKHAYGVKSKLPNSDFVIYEVDERIYNILSK